MSRVGHFAVAVAICVLTISHVEGVLDDDTKSCPTDWVAFGDSCYYLNDMNTRIMGLTFDKAKQKCKNLNSQSDLVTLDTKEEVEFLRGYLQKNFIPIRYVQARWLTAGKKINGVWTWESTGKAVDQTLFRWGGMEPGTTDCLLFHQSYDFKMGTSPCNIPYDRFAICEVQGEKLPS